MPKIAVFVLAAALAPASAGAAADKSCAELGIGPSKAQPVIPTIDRQRDPDGMNRLIARFAPVFYLHKEEKYFPMSAESYFTSTHTSLWDREGNKELIPAGQVTMERIYGEFLKRGKIEGRVYFKNHDCARFGTHPAKGRLSVPVYAVAFQHQGSWYLQYFSLWGYNGSYPLAFMGFRFKPQIGGQHVGDIEHITIKLNRQRTDIEQIYFAAHGSSTDGMSVPKRQVEIDKATRRPVVYSALSGHGSYPRAGIYVRIASVASDLTGRGYRWDPKVVRILPHTHPGFDPKTMGWIYTPGTIGPDGIAALGFKDWFGLQGAVPAGKPPPGKPCATCSWARVEERPLRPLENWCPSSTNYACMLQKMGKKAVWKPIADAVRSNLKKGARKVKDALKKVGKKLKFW